MTTPLKLVILDRDGTINEDSDQFIRSPDEWIPIPGALQAIARLNHAGFRVVIATNQSGVGRGYFDMATLNATHDKMRRLLAEEGGRIDAIFCCTHAPEDGCHCRKPLPRLFEEIAQRYQIGLQDVAAVGDSLRDLEAAFTAGASPVLVRTGKGKKTQEKGSLPLGTVVFDDLAAFVDDFLQRVQVNT
ncbi:MAG: D-glycero-beta-D-manno-heptose 1,7-bisphosphate 7-phosphatase [Saezia sp.]